MAAHAQRSEAHLTLSYLPQLQLISTLGVPTHLETVRFAANRGFVPQSYDRSPSLGSQAYTAREEPCCSVSLGWKWDTAHYDEDSNRVSENGSPPSDSDNKAHSVGGASRIAHAWSTCVRLRSIEACAAGVGRSSPGLPWASSEKAHIEASAASGTSYAVMSLGCTAAGCPRDTVRFGRGPGVEHWPSAPCCMRLGAQGVEEMLRQAEQQKHSEQQAGSVSSVGFRLVREPVVVLGDAPKEAGQQCQGGCEEPCRLFPRSAPQATVHHPWR